MSETPVRNIRISDTLWDRVNRAAEDNEESAAAFIRRVLINATQEKS